VADARAIPRLSRRSKAAVLALAVLLFLLVNGPIWTHPSSPDASILWSYAVIPFLVLAFLIAERKLRLSTLIMESVLLAILKFGITASMLIFIWMLHPVPPVPPARRLAPRETAVPAIAAPEAEERAIAPAAGENRIAGLVVDADGRPAPGALVWISAGLDAYRWTVPPEPVSLRVGPDSFTPALSAVRVRQALVVSSGDGRLHTLDARAEGRTLMNAPILAAAPRTLRFSEAPGLCSLRCDVHPEETGTLLVVAHPFAAVAGPDGRFRFESVPAGPLALSAVSSGRRPVTVPVAVPSETEPRLVLSR
jgi:hypothetical protein